MFKEMFAMIAGKSEIEAALEGDGKLAASAPMAMAMLNEAIEDRLESEERLVRWIEASAEARERMKQAHRRTT
jgi:hypothetical protein